MKIRNVALQAKVKSARHNGAHAALKVVLPSDFQFIEEFRAVRAGMEEGNRESHKSHNFISQLWFLF